VYFENTEHEIIENFVDTGKVRILFKDFTIIGADSVSAAHTAHCADEQEKFWEYHDVLYNNWNGENNGWASNDNLLIFANEIGLDINKLKECNADGRYKSVIEASNEDARLLGLTGTPAFFIISNNDVQKIIGAQPYEVFENIFETMLEK
jgi:protein-disulfide isomerase